MEYMKPDNQILVIFGASGDLTRRKLLPSLFEVFERDMFCLLYTSDAADEIALV